MLCSLSVGGAPAVSFSRRVNKLRALCSRRHRSPWPVTFPATNWPSAKGQTSGLLLRPSPAPSHPPFVHVSPHCYLPHLSHIPVFHLSSPNVSAAPSVSPLPSFLLFHFIFSFPLSPSLSACQSCLQPCIMSWTELLWVWSRSGSGSTRLITENTPVCPASSSLSSSASLYSQGLYGVSM